MFDIKQNINGNKFTVVETMSDEHGDATTWSRVKKRCTCVESGIKWKKSAFGNSHESDDNEEKNQNTKLPCVLYFIKTLGMTMLIPMTPLGYIQLLLTCELLV